MRQLSFILLILSSLFSAAQFNNPYRIASDDSTYFVTNKGNGTVVKIDTSFATSTVIQGLYSPNDIFFGTVAGTSVIVLIDSNQLKLYDASNYSSLLTVNVTGATEAHDGTFNPNNSNEFFVSDRGGNKIIKGVIGPAPFYNITFSTFVSNITKPCGMMIDSRGRMLVVSDTLDADIHLINLSTGADSILAATNLDNLNDISEGPQGNYYVTCWGDNYLYRLDSSMSNEQRMIAFNDPAGMYVNNTYDYLAICCFNCNKVEYKSFHLYSPLKEVTTCANDSFIVDFNPTYNGIGTYNSNNSFIVELSDTSGDYSNAITIGQVNTDTVPHYIYSLLPPGDYDTAGHKFRIRSTSPQTTSYFDKDIFIKAIPKAYISATDTVSTCTGSTITLGTSSTNRHAYLWTPSNLVSDPTSALVTFTQSIGGYDLALYEYDSINQCANSTQAHVLVNPNLTIPALDDSLSICPGDSIEVGTTGYPFYFSWGGSDSLQNPTSSNPVFYDVVSRDLHVFFSDSLLTCSGSDTVHVLVHDTPDFGPLSGMVIDSVCIGPSGKQLQLQLDTNLIYAFSMTNGTFNQNITPPWITLTSADTAKFTAAMTSKQTGCKGTDHVFIKSLPLPERQLPDDFVMNACMKDSTAFTFELDSNHIYQWSKDYFGLDDTNPLHPIFHSDSAKKIFGYPLLITDQNGCKNVDHFTVEFHYVPDELSIDTIADKSSQFLGLIDNRLVNELNASSSNLSVSWYVNTQERASTSENKGHFDRNDMSHGDTLQARLYRVVDGDTVCSFWSDKYIKTNLGSMEKTRIAFRLQPNPANEQISITSSRKLDEILVYSQEGKLIMKSEALTLDVSELRAGIYIVTVRSGAHLSRKKFIKL